MGLLDFGLSWADILVYAGIGATTWLVHFLFIRPYMHPLRKLPGNTYIPLVGNMRELMTGEAMDCNLRFIEKYGTLFRYYFMFGMERVLVADPAVFKQILITNCKNYIKPPSRMKLMREILGEGLILSEGRKHAMHKKLMSPAFNHTSIKKMVPVFQARVEALSGLWEKHITQGGHDSAAIHISDDLCRTTLDIIGLTAFGYEFHSLENPDNATNKAFQSLLEGSGLNWKFAIPLLVKLPFRDVVELKKNVAIVMQTVSGIVELKRELLISGKDVGPPADLLDMLMCARDESSGEGMTDTELRDEVMNIMLAGHETTSTAMSWCLLMLAQRPEIQERVRAEVRRVFPGPHDELTWDKLEQLQYCGCVIKELLRLLPPVPLTIRQALSDDVIKGYHIPAGTILVLAIGPMMRQESHFPDPCSFNPDRFYTEDANKNMYTYLPFLIGPRMCLGYKFALMEMKSFMTILFRKFRFEVIEGQTYARKARITMKPSPALMLKVSKI